MRFHLEPLDATGNVRITFFFDPDGVLLEFIQGHLDHHEVWNAGIVEEVHARPLPARPTFDHVAMTVRTTTTPSTSTAARSASTSAAGCS